ncbi:hypothetical protein PV721_40790 [Streptomyces sp. MB09-01]|uniref:hypothetical protein n=1 Tax=Streptomyces sp. MB09-01 TaxID=3028666 RepID=UPI0029BBDEDD|nr:hypothetical protein [Streptomyces sp. MB09-01]MDX3540527.1 hypothetical protein [Streptomyces sp. MB09-01]
MPLEDDLGAALRRAGDGFTADRDALVNAGEQRGRRLVARRRQAAAAGGSVLALALIATAGAYSGGLLDGAGRAGTVNVASPPTTPAGDDKGPLAGSGAVTAEQMIANLRALLPGGQLTEPVGRGSDDQVPLASGVYDDGKGRAAVSIGLSRVDPDGSQARAMTECGDENLQEYDYCRTEQLADGSRLLLFKGYEYPDRREDTKVWRAVLATRQGFMVELSEWNAPAEKGAPVSRSNPPLTTDQLKTVVTSAVWQPALNDLPAPEPESGQSAPPGSSAALRDREAAVALEELVAGIGIEIPILSKGGEGGHGYVVFDDGKGKSLVQLNVGQGLSGFPGLNQPPLPDGTLVNVKQGPAEKGKGVIEWQVDTLRTDGLRVVVSAFNTANQSGTATREQPALTLDQLKEIALAPGWNRTRN